MLEINRLYFAFRQGPMNDSTLYTNSLSDNCDTDNQSNDTEIESHSPDQTQDDAAYLYCNNAKDAKEACACKRNYVEYGKDLGGAANGVNVRNVKIDHRTQGSGKMSGTASPTKKCATLSCMQCQVKDNYSINSKNDTTSRLCAILNLSYFTGLYTKINPNAKHRRGTAEMVVNPLYDSLEASQETSHN